MKNKICTALLFVLLITPVFSEPEDATVSDTDVVEKIESVQEEEILTEPQEDIAPAAPYENYQTPYKKPISRRKIVKKFLLAMLGVGFSSLVIYFGLSVYNKFREGLTTGSSSLNEEEKPKLSAPDDLTDAIKSFLNNTKWD